MNCNYILKNKDIIMSIGNKNKKIMKNMKDNTKSTFLKKCINKISNVYNAYFISTALIIVMFLMIKNSLENIQETMNVGSVSYKLFVIFTSLNSFFFFILFLIPITLLLANFSVKLKENKLKNYNKINKSFVKKMFSEYFYIPSNIIKRFKEQSEIYSKEETDFINSKASKNFEMYESNIIRENDLMNYYKNNYVTKEEHKAIINFIKYFDKTTLIDIEKITLLFESVNNKPKGNDNIKSKNIYVKNI